MADVTRGNISTTKSKVSVSTLGPTADNMQANGKTANNMAKGFIRTSTKSKEQVSGKKAKGLPGLMMKTLRSRWRRLIGRRRRRISSKIKGG